MHWDGPVFSGLSEKKSDFVTCQTGPPGGLAPIPGHAAAHPRPRRSQLVGLGFGKGAPISKFQGPPQPNPRAQPIVPKPRWVCGRRLPHGPRSRPGCRDGLAVVYPRSRDAGGLVQAAGCRETPCHQSTPNIYLWADLCRYIYIRTPTPGLPIYIPLPSSQPTRDLPGGLDPAPCLPVSSPPHPRPDEAAIPPGTPPTPPRQPVNPPAA